MKLPIPGIFPKLQFSSTLLVLCLILLLALGAMFSLGMLSGQWIRWEITNLPAQTQKLRVLPKFTIPEDPGIAKEEFTLILEKNIFDAKRLEISNESPPSPKPEADVILEVKSQSENEIETKKNHSREIVKETVSQIKVRSPVSHPEKKLEPGFQEKPLIKTKQVPDLKQEMLPSESEQVSRLPISADQETFHLQREWVDEQLANFAKILQDARVEPVTVDQQTFFQFKFIKKGSMYEALGLKKDDIILAINEKMIDNVTKAMGLLQKLQSEREIALTVKRKESEKILRYYIN